MVPNPSGLLQVADDKPVSDGNTADSKINKEDKATQRGPHVAQAYLEALFSKASVVSTDKHRHLGSSLARKPGFWI